MAVLQIALQNQTSSSNVNAYVTGQAIDNNNALFLLQSDGRTPYYPSSPSSTGQSLAVNCAIPLGAPGNTVYIQIPHLAGARLWYCIDDTLQFFLNPGPGLVEPSVTNNSDKNINKRWDFSEFTFNSDQLYANITYVDFVSIPVSMTLTNQSNAVKHISGMNQNGLAQIVSGLQQQTNSDHQPWASLVTNYNGQALRVLSPNSYLTMNNSAFQGYFDGYVSQCWSHYTGGSNVTVNTQAQWGAVQGTSNSGGSTLTFPSGISFGHPSAADIFSCSTGPFAAGQNITAEQLNIGARLAAALNRSTLLNVASQPDGATASQYYQTSPTNHYSRVVHAANLDGRGYAFPYDDVAPNNGADQSGFVNDGAPKLLTVTIGGRNATANVDEATTRQNGLIQAAPKIDAPTAAPTDGSNKDADKTPVGSTGPSTPAEPKPQAPPADNNKSMSAGCLTALKTGATSIKNKAASVLTKTKSLLARLVKKQ